MEEVAVIVPYYKNKLNYLEEISLKRIHDVLSQYPIIYIAPESMDIQSQYDIEICRFNSEYFKSVKTYNDLLLNPDFYRRFLDCRYILICQFDVFIFSNKLSYFCDLGYDYYGAPWINGTPLDAGNGMKIKFAGNGGLSLRNVEKTISLLERHAGEAAIFSANEDYFFSYFASKEYRVAPTDICRQFCIETNVQMCMKMNKGELPFGTHAWERYDLEYWKPYIESFGYDLSGINTDEGSEDREIKKGFFRRISANIMRYFSDMACRRSS